MNWFSAALQYVCFIEQKAVDSTMNVLLLAASSWDNAFERALALGRSREESYRNGAGERVDWRLVEVTTLDELSDDLDGREVYSYPSPIELEGMEPDHLDPASHRPTQAGV